MAEIDWQPLPPLWPDPAVWTDFEELTLLVFTQDGAPIWEVRRKVPASDDTDDLVASGGADTFEAAKAAALFEAKALSQSSQ